MASPACAGRGAPACHRQRICRPSVFCFFRPFGHFYVFCFYFSRNFERQAKTAVLLCKAVLARCSCRAPGAAHIPPETPRFPVCGRAARKSGAAMAVQQGKRPFFSERSFIYLVFVLIIRALRQNSAFIRFLSDAYFAPSAVPDGAASHACRSSAQASSICAPVSPA